MKTLNVLTGMGMGTLVEAAKKGVQLFHSLAPLYESPSERGVVEEVVAQVTDLVLALGAEEEVMDAAQADLASLECVYPGEEVMDAAPWRVGWDEYRRTFVVLAELLVRLAEDSGRGAEVCSFISEQVGGKGGGWRDKDYIARLWGDVVEGYLTRAAPHARWVIGDLTTKEEGSRASECGWWVTEEASGLRFFLYPYHLPDGGRSLYQDVQSVWRADMWYDSPVTLSLYQKLMDLRPRLLEEAWEYLGMSALSEEELAELPREELRDIERSARQAWREMKIDPSCWKSSIQPGRAWEALCVGELEEVADRILYPRQE